ncbi:hypothetical protein Hte_007695 [Hypoxylon texense]
MNRVAEPDDPWVRRRAEEDAREARAKNQMITKLKQHGLLLDDQIDEFKRDVVRCEDDKRSLRETRRRQHEIDEKFEKMSLHFFLPGVVERIKYHAPNDRAAQIYEDVVSVVPDSWIMSPREPVSPREEPETPFSVSRAPSRSKKSNAELIDILVTTAKLESREAISIRGQITWYDSMDSKGNSGMLGGGTSFVNGGRLGRNHMLDDVPNHYVRDRLMNYILTMLDEDRREETKKAVFFDLGAAEIEQYSAIIWQKQKDIELKERAEWEESERAFLKRENQKAAMAANSERQDTLINEIETNIDLTPRPGFGVRDYHKVESISGSVVKPGVDRPGFSGAARMEPEERDIDVGNDIDRDCDQIRAMIARFVKESEWSCDQFRWALRWASRAQLNTFLEKRGPSAGKQSNIFPLSWEYFKKREMLGYSLTDNNTPNDAGVLRERDGNRRKRPNAGGKEKTRGKRTRT